MQLNLAASGAASSRLVDSLGGGEGASQLGLRRLEINGGGVRKSNSGFLRRCGRRNPLCCFSI
jgi:hypothetical protein